MEPYIRWIVCDKYERTVQPTRTWFSPSYTQIQPQSNPMRRRKTRVLLMVPYLPRVPRRFPIPWGARAKAKRNGHRNGGLCQLHHARHCRRQSEVRTILKKSPCFVLVLYRHPSYKFMSKHRRDPFPFRPPFLFSEIWAPKNITSRSRQ